MIIAPLLKMPGLVLKERKMVPSKPKPGIFKSGGFHFSSKAPLFSGFLCRKMSYRFAVTNKREGDGRYG